MEQAPTDKPRKEALITPCRKCGKMLDGYFLPGIKAPIRTICQGCKAVIEYPEVEAQAAKKQMAIGRRSAAARTKPKAKPR